MQSESLTIEDPEFQTVVEQLSDRLGRTDYVENVNSPFTGDAPVSADGHSALVEFEITGDDLEARDRIEPSQEVIDGVAATNPDFRVEQFGERRARTRS